MWNGILDAIVQENLEYHEGWQYPYSLKAEDDDKFEGEQRNACERWSRVDKQEPVSRSCGRVPEQKMLHSRKPHLPRLMGRGSEETKAGRVLDRFQTRHQQQLLPVRETPLVSGCRR